MANGGFEVNKDTWRHIPEEQKSWIMYETMQVVICKLKKLERWNKALSFFGGMIGGMVASYGAQLIK